MSSATSKRQSARIPESLKSDLGTSIRLPLRESMYLGKPSNHTYRLAVTWVGGTQLELMQPLTGYSCYDDFLERKGEGLHHIKEKVDDCQQAIAEYAKKGIRVMQSGKFGEDEFYYLDTEPTVGIVIE